MLTAIKPNTVPYSVFGRKAAGQTVAQERRQNQILPNKRTKRRDIYLQQRMCPLGDISGTFWPVLYLAYMASARFHDQKQNGNDLRLCDLAI